MKPRVFVVQPIPEVALDVLREVAEVEVYPHLDRMISVAEMVEGARRSDYLFAMHGTMVPAEVINANPDLKGLGVLGGKTAKVDFDAAFERKLPVVSGNPAEIVGGGVSLATCDLTVGMIIALAYRLADSDRYTRQGHFKQEQTMALMGIGCPGKTVGLIGLGRVALPMVPRLRALEMPILYTKRTRLSAEQERELGIEWAELDDLLRQSDFVCLECGYNPSTHKLVGARELGLMKRTAYLVNTARGRIVDQPALIKALLDGTIAGAALDTFWHEPPMRYEPWVPDELRKLENVILTPHNGGATWQVRGELNKSVARAIVALIKGERPAGLINPEIYGEPKRFPELYGRGPAVPIAMGGIENYEAQA